MASYAALFVLGAAVVGGTEPPTTTRIAWKATSAGTLIFGIREQTEVSDGSGADYFLRNSRETRSALTLRSYSTFGFVSELDRRSLNDRLTACTLDPRIADLSSAQTNMPPINEPVVSRAGDLGIAPMQIALADQSVFVGDITSPVPEPATWVPATLAAVAIGWSQRRRFTRISAKRKGNASRSNWILIIVGSFLVSIVSSSANLLHLFPETSAAQRAAVLSRPVSAATGSPSIHLGQDQSAIVSGAPGQTVVLSLRNFRMSGNSTFTLQGTATTTFIINVRNQFSLSGTARIVLSGGVQWNNVTFHVMGTGSDVTLSQYSSLEGMLIANQRTVRMSGHAIVRGSVNARRIVLRGSAQIIHPPVTSP